MSEHKKWWISIALFKGLPIFINMRKHFFTLVLCFVLGFSLFCSTSSAMDDLPPLDPCTGCVDSTVAPQPPPPESHYYLIDLRGTATWSIDITQNDGICKMMLFEVGSGGTVLACDDTDPCTPLVDISVFLDGDIAFTEEHWHTTVTGHIGRSNQSTFSDRSTDDATVQLFLSNVPAGCGKVLDTDVTYSVKFFLLNIFGGQEIETTFVGQFQFPFLCSSCGPTPE